MKMKKNSRSKIQNYKDNFSSIRVKKHANDDKIIKMISPELSHQENNYYYNTKINRLILQEAPNNNIKNIYHQPSQINKSISIYYDDLYKERDSNLFALKRTNDKFFNTNSSFENLRVNKVMPIENENSYKNDINYINYNNTSLNNNSNNIYPKQKINNQNISASNRENNNSENKKYIKKNQRNFHFIKTKINSNISPDNHNNYQIRKSNIKTKYISKKFVLNNNKENNEFKENYFKKKKDIKQNRNKNIGNEDFLNNRSVENNKKNSPRDKEISQKDSIYYKNKAKNSNTIEINKFNNKTKGFLIKLIRRANRIRNSNNLLEEKLEKFCGIIEEIYFLSFKSSYIYFIKSLESYVKNKYKSRALILRRFAENKKFKKVKANHSMIEVNNENKYKDLLYKNTNKKNKIESYNKTKKSHSPVNQTEIKNNLTNSIIKTNNDDIIKIYNSLLKKEIYNKEKFVSSLDKIIDTANSFGKYESNKSYNKYSTNPKKYNNLFQRDKYSSPNNPKINNELESNNKYIIKDKDMNINEQQIYFYNRWTVNSHKNSQSNLIKKMKNVSVKNSCLKYKNNEKNINFNNNQNNILYSKPLQKNFIDTYEKKTINTKKLKNKNNFDINFYSKSNRSLNFQKNEFDNYNYGESNEIIIKNVKTEDKRLFVFVKYISFENDIKWTTNNKFDKNDLCVIQTDSFKILKKNFKSERITINFGNHFHIENKNILSERYNDNLNNEIYSDIPNISEIQNIDENYYTCNYFTIKNTEKITKYLVSLLQNIYKDNIKQVLFIFFKNLKKIERNSFIHAMKLENTNHYKKRNRNLNNESTSNLSQNKEVENKKKLRCNTQDESVSTNLINLNSENIIFKNEDNIFNKVRNDKIKGKNPNEIAKEKIEKRKLEKLGKLFYNLNKENDIITSIKEQFLDWTNQNPIHSKSNIKNDFENKDNRKNLKEYQVKTFNRKYLFNKDMKYKENEDEFVYKVNKFRLKLILFGIKDGEKKKK